MAAKFETLIKAFFEAKDTDTLIALLKEVLATIFGFISEDAGWK